MIKKFLSVFIVCILIFCTGCVHTPIEEKSTTDTTSVETTAPTTSETEPEEDCIQEGFLGGLLPSSREETFGTMDNGDTYYTPAGVNFATDSDRAVYYYNNLLVAYTNGELSQSDCDTIATTVNGQIVGRVSGAINCIQIKVAPTTLTELEALAQTLTNHNDILYACPEYPIQSMSANDLNPWSEDNTAESDLGNEETPDGNDWWAEAIGAYSAWEYEDQSEIIGVGVTDSGFYTEHEDLAGQLNIIGLNSLQDADHGTHVAGVMAALNNDKGIRGIYPKGEFYCADIDPSTEGYMNQTMGQLMAIYNQMAQNGVRIINNSWGCLLPDADNYSSEIDYNEWCNQRTTKDIIPTAEAMIVTLAQLYESGYGNMIMVQASGNGYFPTSKSADEPINLNALTGGFFCSITESVFDNLDTKLGGTLKNMGLSYEHIDSRIYIVGAFENIKDENGNYKITNYSNYGETVDLYAPGENILSTVTYGYSFSGGTSMAAPIATASIAYAWSLNPDLSPEELRDIILQSPVKATGIIYGESETKPALNLSNAVEMIMKDR